MRSVPRRPAVVLLVGAVTLGVAGISRIATAQPLPTGRPAAARAVRPPLPPRQQPRAAKPTGDDKVELVVGLKRSTSITAAATRLERAADVEVDAVDSEAKALHAVTAETTAAGSAEALAELRRDPSVSYAEVNGRYYASELSGAGDVQPNDPVLAQQWNLTQTGMPTAWRRTTGSSDVVVAVIDTGVSPIPELAGALLPGHDFVNDDANAADDEGHGTMVASLIAANTDNALGIAGGCWTCEILPIKVLDRDGGGDWWDVAAGVDYAVAQHANVINLSLGGLVDSEVLRTAVQNAMDHGILVVAAAGNEGLTANATAKQYPAAQEGVLSVGATDELDHRYLFSTHGPWVEMAAPGRAWMDAMDGQPAEAFGTSFSAPLVAAAGALVLAEHPAATAKEVHDLLIATATNPDGSFAHGRLDAAAAVQSLPFTGRATPSARLTGPANRYLRGPVDVTLATGADTVSVQGLDDGVDLGTDTAAPWSITWSPDAGGRHTADGSRTIQLVVTNAAGERTTVPVWLSLDRTAPRATGTTPAQNSRNRGTVTVTATGVSDAGGMSAVTLYADGRWIGYDTTAPFAVRYNLSARNGPVALRWKLIDRVGNVGYFDRTIIADNTAPSVRITKGPKNKARVSGTVKLTVAAADRYGVSRVELLVNGKKVASDAKAAYTFAVKVAKYGRTLKVRVRAYDLAGNVRYDTTRTWRR